MMRPMLCKLLIFRITNAGGQLMRAENFQHADVTVETITPRAALVNEVVIEVEKR